MNLRATVMLCIFPFFYTPSAFPYEYSYANAVEVLTKIYRAERGIANSFYCGCRIKWEGDKGSPVRGSCGYSPKEGKETSTTTTIEWEHLVPASWMGDQLRCWKALDEDGKKKGRNGCSSDPGFKKMEGDMHNIVPVIGQLNRHRSDHRFGVLSGETRDYGRCDFEVRKVSVGDISTKKNKRRASKKVEPSDDIKGDIARAYLYMAGRYNFRISKSQMKLMRAWDKVDPVIEGGWEQKRNGIISGIQKSGNSCIEKSSWYDDCDLKQMFNGATEMFDGLF